MSHSPKYQEAIMSAFILSLTRPQAAGADDRDKWVVVVCIAGFCVLTLADWLSR